MQVKETDRDKFLINAPLYPSASLTYYVSWLKCLMTFTGVNVEQDFSLL